jgi:hypothetical protein
MNRLKDILQNPLKSTLNMQFYCSLLKIFKARLLNDSNLTSIFENFVFISKDSILLKP